MKKYVPIFLAALLWVWPGIFIKYLGEYFSSYTQNFYRFFAASAFLLLLGFFRSRKILSVSFKNIKLFIMPAAFVLLAQITWVEGVMLTEPAFASFLRRSSILFVMLFSFWFFQTERNIISSKRFALSSCLCLLGVAGVIMGGNGMEKVDFNLGAGLVLVSAFFWALFIVSIRRVAGSTDSLVSTGIIFSLTLPFFLAGGILKGDVAGILSAGRFTNLMLFSSGILFVGLANTLQYKSIKVIGSSLTANLVLSTPFFTAIASYYIFGEVLTLIQLVSGGVLIMGCALLLKVEGAAAD